MSPNNLYLTFRKESFFSTAYLCVSQLCYQRGVRNNVGSMASGTYDEHIVVVKKINAVKNYSGVGKKIFKEAEIAYSLDHKNI